VEQVLKTRPHPEQGYRSCLGLMRLARQPLAETSDVATGTHANIRGPRYYTRKGAN